MFAVTAAECVVVFCLPRMLERQPLASLIIARLVRPHAKFASWGIPFWVMFPPAVAQPALTQDCP